MPGILLEFSPSKSTIKTLIMLQRIRFERFIFRWNIVTLEKVNNKNSNDIYISFPFSPKKDPEWIVLPDLFEYLRKFIK